MVRQVEEESLHLDPSSAQGKAVKCRYREHKYLFPCALLCFLTIHLLDDDNLFRAGITSAVAL